ncbi:hypothetical protein GCM10009613_51830 [Pseudonocardia kongjuensis]|uniref:Uncharacterized protein n=1 Tax=Pseudonocardia kongjuensis TaxID=102227 RepID=A0ABN1Y9F2_9PSEU
MPHPAPTDASPTGAPRSLRCRRPAASGHRAVAGELAALAFLVPAAAPVAQSAPALPRPRPAAE